MTNEQGSALALNLERFANDMQFVCVSHCKRETGNTWDTWSAHFDRFTIIFNKAHLKWNTLHECWKKEAGIK